MFLLNILLPLIGFISASCFGGIIGKKGAVLLTTTLLAATAFLSIYSFYLVALLDLDYYLNLGTWIQVDVFFVEWGFQFDTLTVIMLCVVTIVSLLVHFYSASYMAADPHLPRFMSYLSLFTFFMLILVCSDNFIVLFLG
jgi:NADH:ubiquinone oxidoreductase subunit 5 (subunit L)/multisubunit Na+/H+ antiporter MnhA subunit